MKISVNRDKCIACGICWSLAPEIFREGDDKPQTVIAEEYRVKINDHVSVGEVPLSQIDKIKNVIRHCPVEAISLEEQ